MPLNSKISIFMTMLIQIFRVFHYRGFDVLNFNYLLLKIRIVLIEVIALSQSTCIYIIVLLYSRTLRSRYSTSGPGCLIMYDIGTRSHSSL